MAKKLGVAVSWIRSLVYRLPDCGGGGEDERDALGGDGRSLTGAAEGAGREVSGRLYDDRFEPRLGRSRGGPGVLAHQYRDNIEVATAALLAGKHVVCVKPMAMNLKQVDQLIALAEKRKRLLWCFDQLGRTGINLQLQLALEKKLIGTPISYHHTMFSGLPLPWPGKTGKSWWMDPEQVPWGAWADHAIYTIDQLRALFKSEVVEVCGVTGNRVYKNLAVDDHGIGVLRFANGMEAVIEDAWVAQGYHPYWTKITGTNGVLRMDRVAFGDAVMIETAKGVKPTPKKAQPASRGMLQVPVGLILKGDVSTAYSRDSRINMAIALAVYKASKTGKYVRPEEMK